MSGDYSRLSFDPLRDYAAVQLQQGRLLTDADWNEQAAIASRRVRVEALDTFGRAVVPRTQADAFRVGVSGARLTLGRGRMYVDGLLVENHGGGAPQWDAALDELAGSAALFHDEQPFLRPVPALPTTGSWVAYLDVWQRELTHLQDAALIEKAIGVDTTTRLQTVWQVKLHAVERALAASGATCANAVQNDAGWAAMIAPAASRLSSGTVELDDEPNPCLIPPGVGYKGLENQLYRVQIHRGGRAGEATFKWSRDNASVASRVARIVDATHVIVDSTGKDGVLRFSDGDWIEFVDEADELSGTHGELRRIRVGEGVDDATRRITLDQPLPAQDFPPGVPPAERALRVRRWDQHGRVRREDGGVHVDLDAGGTNGGAIPVPAAGTRVVLENGVAVSFSLADGGAAAGRRFRSGEWWVFTARAADGSVETLREAPPRGPHHHYAKLAVLSFPNPQPGDCRVLWPPESGDCCGCTVCVSPQAHADGSLTVQAAIDRVISAGGGTVCLDVGQYALARPLQIVGARSLRLRGQGSATVLTAASEALDIRESNDVAVEELSIQSAPRPEGTTAPPATADTPLLIGRPAPSDLRATPAGPTTGSTAPSTRTSSYTFSGGVQRMMRLSSGAARAPGGFAEAVDADRQATTPAPDLEVAPPQALIAVETTRELRLSALRIAVRVTAGTPPAADADTAISGVAVLVLGTAPGLRIEHCTILAPIGVLGMPGVATSTAGLVLDTAGADMSLSDNHVRADAVAVAFTGTDLASAVRIERNVLESDSFGLLLAGDSADRVRIADNRIQSGACVMCGAVPALELRGNRIGGGGTREPGTIGVLLMNVIADRSWGRVDIHDNTFDTLRGVSVAVARRASGMRLHVSHNRFSEVGRGVIFSGFVAGDRDAVREDGAAADSVRVEHNDFLRLAGERADVQPCALALLSTRATVIGNQIESGNPAPLIGVDAGTHCELSSNVCARETLESPTADVYLRLRSDAGPGTAIVANNRLSGAQESLRIEAVPSVPRTKRCTVIGNIVRGRILVNAVPVPDPIEQFNVIDAAS